VIRINVIKFSRFYYYHVFFYYYVIFLFLIFIVAIALIISSLLCLPHHRKALNSLICADVVLLRNYSLTHSSPS